MRRITISMSLLFLLATAATATTPSDFAAAQALSESTGKPLLLDFMADW
ncbi:MAG TPA: hypothetical protein P5571_06900 [Candidatus Krumholzibacteria bacterium]|nr:hypothetical protein [Candidatus Krumholzibacteria bacterium]HRX51072.1 hypothetical protein [Candidatus Krumholzibacteria bacterium]